MTMMMMMMILILIFVITALLYQHVWISWVYSLSTKLFQNILTNMAWSNCSLFFSFVFLTFSTWHRAVWNYRRGSIFPFPSLFFPFFLPSAKPTGSKQRDKLYGKFSKKKDTSKQTFISVCLVLPPLCDVETLYKSTSCEACRCQVGKFTACQYKERDDAGE